MSIWKRKAVLFFVMWFLLILAPEALAQEEKAEYKEEIELYARSAVLMDGDSGRILYGKNQDQEMAMASTTKIMTCIVALEHADLDLICEVSQNAASQPKVKLGMKKGEQFYLKDLLYSLMLESHNDSAVCIAEAVGGSEAGFAKLMNQKAAEIGCRHTYYITPNGLDAKDEHGIHHTTAEELALVMRYCLKESSKTEEFLEITRTASYIFSNVEKSRDYSCRNHNALLTMMDGVLSGKTGFTGKAGYCYVGAVEQEGEFLIVALLACGWPNNRGYKWVDAKKLIRYGMENFEIRSITDKNLNTEPITVRNGVKAMAETRVLWPADHEIQTILMRKKETVHVRITQEKELFAPVDEKTIVGKVFFLVGDKEYAVFPVITAEKVNARDYIFWLRNLCNSFVNFMTKKLAFFG